MKICQNFIVIARGWVTLCKLLRNIPSILKPRGQHNLKLGTKILDVVFSHNFIVRVIVETIIQDDTNTKMRQDKLMEDSEQ